MLNPIQRKETTRLYGLTKQL